jgi:hypothetical protein
MPEIYQQCEGTLEVQDDLSPQEQFNNWMDRKNVDQTNITNTSPSRLVQRLLEQNENLGGYDRCFGKEAFDRGGGYDKGGFDKWCF